MSADRIIVEPTQLSIWVKLLWSLVTVSLAIIGVRVIYRAVRAYLDKGNLLVATLYAARSDLSGPDPSKFFFGVALVLLALAIIWYTLVPAWRHN
jgi:hypothetical protein